MPGISRIAEIGITGNIDGLLIPPVSERNHIRFDVPDPSSTTLVPDTFLFFKQCGNVSCPTRNIEVGMSVAGQDFANSF